MDHGTRVFVPERGIPFLAFKLKKWQENVPKAGGTVTQNARDPGITHVLVGQGGITSLPSQFQPRPTAPRVGVQARPSGSTQARGRAAEDKADRAAPQVGLAAGAVASRSASLRSAGGAELARSGAASSLEAAPHADTSIAVASPAEERVGAGIQTMAGTEEGRKPAVESGKQAQQAQQGSLATGPRSPAAPITPKLQQLQALPGAVRADGGEGPASPPGSSHIKMGTTLAGGAAASGPIAAQRDGQQAGQETVASRPIERLPEQEASPVKQPAAKETADPGAPAKPAAPLRLLKRQRSPQHDNFGDAAGPYNKDSKGSAAQRGAAAKGPKLVDFTWLERCLAEKRLLDESQFPPAQPKPRGSGKGDSGGSSSAESSDGEMSLEARRRRRWLGEYWKPEFEDMSLIQLALQNIYSEERSKRIGNEPLVQLLRELGRYERALIEDFIQDPSKGGEHAANHRSLRYARAASVVRGCAYKLEPPVHPGQLPFVGDATARQIDDILATGTCQTLDLFRQILIRIPKKTPVSRGPCRADLAVIDSKGKLRRGTEGGRTRAMFHSLPGTGQRSAKLWWDLGYRSFEDVEEAAQPGGPLAADGAYPLTIGQMFSLKQRKDILTEMDLLVTHPTRSVEGVVIPLRDHLVKQGMLLPPEEAMCQVQAGLLPTHIEKLRQMHLADPSHAPGHETLDRFDHIYGVYRTKAGHYRRMDIIICPADEWPMALVGWIGSRQYLRFMRQHAKDLGMLMRKVGNESFIIPDEKPPLNREGQEWWPAGWSRERKIDRQQDLFELLDIPYREPGNRQCPG
ncbi:hypothetical protein N2152v2_010914 [Parachlorella kessleri]